MTTDVLQQCPICGARLNGSDSCRRCRTELETVRCIAQESAALAGAGLQRLAVGDYAAAIHLLRRANVLHATPELAQVLGPVGAQRRTD